MSRIGKKPIPVPQGVKAIYAEGILTVTGSKGSLQRAIHPRVQLELAADVIRVYPGDESQSNWQYWGLTRSLVANMVTGVSQGFIKALEIVGTGYKVEDKGDRLVFNLGYSHPIEFILPPGISAKVEKATKLVLEGYDKEVLGQTAAVIRRLRPPEPYKGKGIKYANEVIRRKVGKSGSR
jgi:large subunit ribosomal protein L6